MAQTGPWENYQPQSEVPPAGPWSKYAPVESSSTPPAAESITIGTAIAPRPGFGEFGTPGAAPRDVGEIRPPTQPPLQLTGWKPPEEKPVPKTWAGFGENVLNSLDTFLTGLVSPVTHPVQTTQNLSNLFMGMSEKTGFAPVMGQSHTAQIDALAAMYKQRYGSVQGFKDAWYQDPVGMLSDLLTVASAGTTGYAAAGDFIKAMGLEGQAAKAALTLKALPKAPLAMAKGAVSGAITGGLTGLAEGVLTGKPMEEAAHLAKLGSLWGVREGWKTAKKAATEAYEAKLATEAADMEKWRAAQRFAVDRPPPERIGVFRRDEPPTAPPSPPSPSAAPVPPMAAPAVTMEDLAPALTNGKPLSKLTKTERAQVQAVYDRIQHPLEVSEPTAAERAIITPASEATATLEYNAPQAQPEPLPPRGKTAAELLQEEIAAKRAAAAETPAVPLAQQTPAEAQAAFEQAKAAKTIPVQQGEAPAQTKADFEARQKPAARAEEAVAPPAAATPPAAQNLSDLMTGELPKLEQPGRSMYTETGELKSARQRGQEIKLANIEAKAQRFSKALTEFGMDPADVAKVKEGWVTAEAMAKGSPPGWENVMHDLIAKGLLDKAEKRAPSESVPRIVELMQQKQIAKPATAPAPQNLSELMKPPKPAPAAPKKKPAGKPRRTPPER